MLVDEVTLSFESIPLRRQAHRLSGIIDCNLFLRIVCKTAFFFSEDIVKLEFCHNSKDGNFPAGNGSKIIRYQSELIFWCLWVLNARFLRSCHVRICLIVQFWEMNLTSYVTF